MDQVVMQTLNLTRSESSGPMRGFQLAAEQLASLFFDAHNGPFGLCACATSLARGDCGACKEAIVEMAGQKRLVLQVLDRLSLGVQKGLYALDDLYAMRQKQPQELNVCLKRHLTKRLPRHAAPLDESAPIRERV
jgi:hypothetical protein